MTAIERRAGSGDEQTRSVAEVGWCVIESIVTESERLGAFVVLGWAGGDSPSYGWLADRAEQRDVAFADWYTSVRSARASMRELGMKIPHSGGHWRSWVNARIAEAFARELEARIP
jgi:hypothetical protein